MRASSPSDREKKRVLPTINGIEETMHLTNSDALLHRIREHQRHFQKQKQKNTIARDSAISAASVRIQKALQSQTAKSCDFASVDHCNQPHRWKQIASILNETKTRDFQRRIREPTPVRPFPPEFHEKNALVRSPFRQENRQEQEAPPLLRSIKDDEEFLQLDQSTMPLEFFDDANYERHSPSEWLAICPKGFAQYYHNNAFHWYPCQVLSYDPSTERFHIRFLGMALEKDVSRLCLRFELESDRSFRERLAKAQRLREMYKSQLRLDHFLQRQTRKGISTMKKDMLENIHSYVIKGLNSKRTIENVTYSELFQGLTNVVLEEYIYSIKKAITYGQYRTDPIVREKFEQLRLLTPPIEPPVPEFGLIRVEYSTFQKHRTRIQSLHYSNSLPLRRVLQLMYASWEAYLKHIVLARTHIHISLTAQRSIQLPLSSQNYQQHMNENSSLQAPFKMIDFQSLQVAHKNSAIKVLLIDWRRTLVENIVDQLQDVYDFFITDAAAYENSMQRRILRSIELRMASQLRDVILQTVRVYTEYVAICTREESDLCSPLSNDLFELHLTLKNGKIRIKPGGKSLVIAMTEPLEALYGIVHELKGIETEVMTLLSFDPKPLLCIEINDSEDAVHYECSLKIRDAIAFVNDRVQKSFLNVHQVALEFSPYLDLLEFDVGTYVGAWNSELLQAHASAEVHKIDAVHGCMANIFKETHRFHDLAYEIETITFDVESLGLICVHTLSVKTQLKQRAMDIRNAFMDAIVAYIRAKSEEITHSYENILRRLTSRPTNEAQVANLKSFIGQIPEIILELKRTSLEMHVYLDKLSAFQYPWSTKDLRLFYALQEWPFRVQQATGACDIALEEDKARMMKKLTREKESFDLDLERYQAQVEAFREYGNVDATHKYMELATTLYDSIQDAKAKARDFNEREAVFQLIRTEYSCLDRLDAEFSPLHTLWTMSAEFAQSRQTYLYGAFLDLNGAEIEKTLNEWSEMSKSLWKSQSDSAPNASNVALNLHEKIKEFRAYLPVIQKLASQALQERHWDAIRQEIGFDESEDELTLHVLLQKGILDHNEAMDRIASAAEKEYSLQKMLTAMTIAWESMQLSCIAHRSTGTYLLQNTNEITALLEEHLIKTQSMRASVFVHYIEKDCKAWEKKLQYAQQLMDEWLQCQRNYVYLQAIFGSEDIIRQMPTEARKFAAIDAFWRKTMDDTIIEPNVMLAFQSDKLLMKFEQANEKLESIQRNLSDYLELKRLIFPRFFFLSNKELLEIVSQTKEPETVQIYLNKCFEGIHRVRFQIDEHDKALHIVEMVSAQGESIALSRSVNVNSSEHCGNVERWLSELEKVQYDSIYCHIEQGIASYVLQSRVSWIQQQPAQIVFAVSRIVWTINAANAIRDNKLAAFLCESEAQLQEIVLLARGNLPKRIRMTVSALITMDVHARDSIRQLMENRVSCVNDFEYLSQMRYEWPMAQAIRSELSVCMMRARVPYMYEYLGNSMRLVLTPLTDRCYRTLFSAIEFLYGGALEGPAGTGKTETVKDLSKAVAIHCVVFNCSQGLDYLAMAKFFKGLAGSGAYCCFDEFNRIETAVLSVVAQQIQTIHEAKRQKSASVVLEGTNLRLLPSANVFITMNPGYNMRNELPDTLQALFRPCAMMIPDFMFIAEIRLYSFGFLEAKTLAHKLVHVLHTTAEQLSHQTHYDYGMRALQSVLITARQLRQRLQSDTLYTEETIVRKALETVNVPKLHSSDAQLFEMIVKDRFPSDFPETAAESEMLSQRIQYICDRGIRSAPESMSRVFLHCTEEFQRKVLYLYQTMEIRHGLMLVGRAGVGKTCILRTTAALASEISDKSFDSVSVHTIYVKAMRISELFGEFDASTREWRDGVFAQMFRDSVRTNARRYIVLDGPVDSVWIESLNTVLDESKKLCLMSGEIIRMSKNMRIVIETNALTYASPATISRVGIVYVEAPALDCLSVLHVWLKTSEMKVIESFRDFIQELFLYYVPPLVYFVQSQCERRVRVSCTELYASCLRLYACLLLGIALDCEERETATEILASLFVQSVVYSIGAALESAIRAEFDQYLRALVNGEIEKELSAVSALYESYTLRFGASIICNRPALTTSLPKTGNMSEYSYNVSARAWTPWRASNCAIPENLQRYSEIFVPTADSERYIWLFQLLTTHHHHILCCGNAGIGKTALILQFLKQNESRNVADTNISINFCAQTSSDHIQSFVTSHLSRQRKNVLGPRLNAHAIAFFDDIHLTTPDAFETRSPIELLRQCMDAGGFYNRSDRQFTQLVRFQCIAATDKSCESLCKRYSRHLHHMEIDSLGTEALRHIFTAFADSFLSNFEQVREERDALVTATLGLYKCIAKERLPTPAKPFYRFEFRDLSRIFQGLTQVNSVIDRDALLRVWSHECLRVFADRMASLEDRKLVSELVESIARETFGLERVRNSNETLLYGRICEYGNERPTHVPYEEISDYYALNRIFQSYSKEFQNNDSECILFQSAREHILRISRVLHLFNGHLLLIGNSGSGQKSLTRLSAFMARFELCQWTNFASEWRNELKKLLLRAGIRNQTIVLLISDSDLSLESAYDDLHMLIKTGRVPNLWSSEEMEEIAQSMSSFQALQGQFKVAELFETFVSQCREHLHVILSFSPVHKHFCRRLRAYPCFISCCTIDYFDEWPKEALQSVARHCLERIPGIPSSLQLILADICAELHAYAEKWSRMHPKCDIQCFYVTPKLFMDFFRGLKRLIAEKRLAFSSQRMRYENGLSKLIETSDQVSEVQEELEALEPRLKAANAETNALLDDITREQQEMHVFRESVAVEEAEWDAQAAAAEELKLSCEKDLVEAIPALEQAVKALQTLTKGDITELKAMKKPPYGVKLVMETVCIMMHVSPNRIKDPVNDGRKMDDYWGPAQKHLLGDTRFLQHLLEYDKDNIPSEFIEKVQPYIENPEFQAESIRKSSVAASRLCAFVHAIVKYHYVTLIVAPKNEALACANEKLSTAKSALAEKQALLESIVAKLAQLEADLSTELEKKEELEGRVNECSKKVFRAKDLTNKLIRERERWQEMATKLNQMEQTLLGDSVLASGCISYLGPFDWTFREKAINDWQLLLHTKVPCSVPYSFATDLGDPVQILAWTTHKLPNDVVSIQNAIIMEKSERFPLLLDPQMQARTYLTKYYESRQFALRKLKQNQNQFHRMLENAVAVGAITIVENVLEEIDPVIWPIVAKKFVTSQENVTCVQIGDNLVPYDPSFRLFLVCSLWNPKFTPEVCGTVNLVNFMATAEGLEDQMLGVIVNKEEPLLEQQREQLCLENVANIKLLREIEDKILELLQSAEGNILNDEKLIDTLNGSKQTACRVEDKVKEAEMTHVRIQEKRKLYKPVSIRASQLYFCLADLNFLDGMYQYALDWFIGLFMECIDLCEKKKYTNMEVRLQQLNTKFTVELYQNVCRSLFEKHKRLFAFLLTCTVLKIENRLDNVEWRYLFTGNTQLEQIVDEKPTGCDDWLSDNMWRDMIGLNIFNFFPDVLHSLHTQTEIWKSCFYSTQPMQILESSLTCVSNLTLFQRLLILRCLRMDAMMPAILHFIAGEMGRSFIEAPPFNLESSFKHSSCITPLLLILTPGADGMKDIRKLAETVGRATQLVTITLGQGQGVLAENAIAEAIDVGMWVCLQNCHLCGSWLSTLEKLCQEITPNRTHGNFRLWLTTEPISSFPILLLQQCIKITKEPRKGVRANLLERCATMEVVGDDVLQQRNLQIVLFGLCFFHALVRERCKFGSLGWNVPYEFSTHDFDISKSLIHDTFRTLQLNENVPFRSFQYTTGECNYGGRVTDAQDRRYLLTQLSQVYSHKIFTPTFRFSDCALYPIPEFTEAVSVNTTLSNYIEGLPLEDNPNLFGLHENANITCAIAESKQFIQFALAMQPQAFVKNETSWDNTLIDMTTNILSRLPSSFDLEQAQLNFPILYYESRHAVFQQELSRYNALLLTISTSLQDLQRALKGMIVLSPLLEAMGNAMFTGNVPKHWTDVGYVSKKPLVRYIDDFLQRFAFFQNWLDSKTFPEFFWISSFFFTRAFITASVQNYIRKRNVLMDGIVINVRVLYDSKPNVPEDGILIRGLFMEGASWDAKEECISESKPRELYVSMPILHLLPKHKDELGTLHVYQCPMYKTSTRRGTLNTTGQSTNFIMFAGLPMARQHSQSHWILRGVALLTQLDT